MTPLIHPQQQFPGKRADEQTIVCAHRHWLFLLPDILMTAFAVLLPVALLVLVNAFGGEPFSEPARNWTVVLLPAWYLGLSTFFFIRWLDFYLDLAVVTNERLMDIDQTGLFRRNIAELEFDAVQDVASNRAGILQTVFNFGDVVIQTASERPNFVFRTVAEPEEIVKKITEQIQISKSKEEEAAEHLEKAAERMSEAAEKVGEKVAEPPEEAAEQANSEAAPPNNRPDQENSAQDLPREYER